MKDDNAKIVTNATVSVDYEKAYEEVSYELHLAKELIEKLEGDSPAIMEIAKYIQWHMYPYNIKKESTKNKAIKILGEKTFNKLITLHKADKAAH